MPDITTEPTADELIDHPEPGLPRLVCETHTRLGPQTTPQQVADKLNSMDFEATPEMVMTSAMDIAAIMAEEKV